MFYVVYNITSTQVAPLTPARGSSFLNEFRAAPGSMKQMLGGGGGGGEGRGPSAVLSLFVSCSLSRLFWQANASKLPSIFFSADPELLKVKHMCFGLPSRYCATHSTVLIHERYSKEVQIAFSQEEEGPRMPLTSCLLDILNSAYRWASLLWEDFSNLSDNLVEKKRLTQPRQKAVNGCEHKHLN